MYDKITSVIINKIERREYLTFNTDKNYLRVELGFDNNLNELNAYLVKNINMTDDFKRSKTIKISCGDKSIEDIVTEFEDNLLDEYIYNATDSILLIYDPFYIEPNLIFKKLIKLLKKMNRKRSNTILSSFLYYENIVAFDILEDKIFSYVFYKLYFYGKYSSSRIKSPIIYINKLGERFISFCIHLENSYHFFNLNVKHFYNEEFLGMINVKTCYKNETDNIIGDFFYNLYKNANIERLSVFYEVFDTFCSIKKIHFNRKTFKMEIIKNKIRIKQGGKIYYYALRKDLRQSEIQQIISEECFLDFQDFFKKFFTIKQSINSHKTVEFLYRLLENNKRVENIIVRILNNRDRALKIILPHLLLEVSLIKESELEDIINKEKHNNVKRMNFMKKLLTILSNHNLCANVYAIKICIFIEAQQIVNENFWSKDQVFDVLKKIQNLIESKERTNNKDEIISSASSNSKSIDLIKIYHEMLKYHISDIEEFKTIVWYNIFQITSLFTGLENNTFEKDFDKVYANKEDVISKFKLDKNKIDTNNEIIFQKLKKNLYEDYFKEEKIKHIKERILKTLQNIKEEGLTDSLNKLKNDALNVEFENFYFEEEIDNYEGKLFSAGKREIEKIYDYDNMKSELESISTNIDINFLNKYKTKEVKFFGQDIRENLKENIKNNIKKQIPKILTNLFQSNLSRDGNFRFKCEKNISYILKSINKKDLLTILNNEPGIKTHDSLVEGFTIQ
ncbi:uncharacterized protein VNE69_09119 [Vairimorpha necatrix]|uniref:Uncharacterized protein n=1 Tax=Vairimorpha necatrix TaxID=6039 RepID=A0AAX4JEZ5_9MICR